MMLNDTPFVRQISGWGGRYLPEQRLSEYTSLGVGGAADLIVITRLEAIEPVVEGLRHRGIPWGLLGGGTNLLPVDEPFQRVFLQLAPSAGELRFEGIRVEIPAAASLARAVMECAKRNLGGMEGLVGVPGSVGGALRMNAGAYGTQIGPLVRSVTLFRGATGRIEQLAAGEIGFAYRHSSFAPDDIVLSVTLELIERPYRDILEQVKGYNEKRRRSQPVKEKSAGCIFKNPPGLSAGKLIDELGLKGQRAGGAVISERHANFIVNRDGATAADIFRLMELIRERVRRAHGIELEEEVIVWKQ
ncbi:MAG TPA: UDP-N-acetylmuramate dehydrogenase [Terriglobia bacterium]|nr:UDP-N-acetylmuramate dehydrogenase [Terriglobia bacterium]